ncbi:hypothetical protein COU03_01460 [bacterium (Candidatus Gribaldobacteria) CG10_big_fil_rev_8_21_14_0_10_41_12]|uniref:Uncharacterized protein n=3 Tax=Candidatus Gribaldobacteria TaxID=2798536 RepID=A0A2H0UXT2_9BACT|nr:MAG: hypothetical protein COU03_01460 [bacterium (Candidatus Gribaldobacteria) CG10_big_fil_rev_8_21_14_0_10_41_12]
MAQTAGLAAGTRELTDENIFQILAQGALVYMEDDLRQLQGESAQVVKEKRKRGWLKIAPQPRAEASWSMGKKESFFSKIKQGLSRPKKQKQALPEKAPAVLPYLSTMPLPPIVTPSNEQTPVAVVPAFSVATPEPKPIIVKKELASGLRLGERVIDLPVQPVSAPVIAPPLPKFIEPVASTPTEPVVATVLPGNFKVEPFFIEELQEKAEQRNRFAQEKSDLDAKLQVFWPQRRPLELKLATLAEEKQVLVKSLSPFIIKDAQIKSQEKEIEQKEKAAALPQERHQLEEQRWVLEQQRRQAAQEKWAQEEKVEVKNNEIKATELQLQTVAQQEGDLRRQAEKASQELEKTTLAQERLMLIEKVAVLDAQRRALGKEKAVSQSEALSLSKQLNELGQQEKAIEAQEASLEEAIDKADSFPEKKEIEQSRWRLDEQRKSTEQKRWEIEKKAEQNKEQAGVSRKSYDEALQKQTALEIRAQDIDILLRKPFASAEGIIAERNKQKSAVEAAKKQEIETRSEQVKPLLPVLNFYDKPVVEGGLEATPIKFTATKPEALLGSEAQTAVKIKQQAIIREREKNLALIQQKAETQRESFIVSKIKGPLSKADILLKLSQVSPEELAGRARFMARLSGRAPSPTMGSMKIGKEIVFRPLVKKSSLFEKVLARIFFLLIIFVVAVITVVLVYFYVILPKSEISLPALPVSPVVTIPTRPATTTPTSTPIFIGQPAPLEDSPLAGSATTTVTTTPAAPIATTTAPTTTPVAVLPQPLIAVQQTKTLQLGATTSMAELLKTALQENQGPGLTEIVFQTNDNLILGLNGFLTVLQTPWPENITDKLAIGDILLFFKQGAISRFGFVVNIKDNIALALALKTWEPQMEKDWAGLWTALGKTKPAEVGYFRSALSGGAAFRYQTFTKQDFGICYAIFNGKLILTTSYAQMKLIINELKKTVAP